MKKFEQYSLKVQQVESLRLFLMQTQLCHRHAGTYKFTFGKDMPLANIREIQKLQKQEMLSNEEIFEFYKCNKMVPSLSIELFSSKFPVGVLSKSLEQNVITAFEGSDYKSFAGRSCLMTIDDIYATFLHILSDTISGLASADLIAFYEELSQLHNHVMDLAISPKYTGKMPEVAKQLFIDGLQMMADEYIEHYQKMPDNFVLSNHVNYPVGSTIVFIPFGSPTQNQNNKWMTESQTLALQQAVYKDRQIGLTSRAMVVPYIFNQHQFLHMTRTGEGSAWQKTASLMRFETQLNKLALYKEKNQVLSANETQSALIELLGKHFQQDITGNAVQLNSTSQNSGYFHFVAVVVSFDVSDVAGSEELLEHQLTESHTFEIGYKMSHLKRNVYVSDTLTNITNLPVQKFYDEVVGHPDSADFQREYLTHLLYTPLSFSMFKEFAEEYMSEECNSPSYYLSRMVEDLTISTQVMQGLTFEEFCVQMKESLSINLQHYLTEENLEEGETISNIVEDELGEDLLEEAYNEYLDFQCTPNAIIEELYSKLINFENFGHKQELSEFLEGAIGFELSTEAKVPYLKKLITWIEAIECSLQPGDALNLELPVRIIRSQEGVQMPVINHVLSSIVSGQNVNWNLANELNKRSLLLDSYDRQDPVELGKQAALCLFYIMPVHEMLQALDYMDERFSLDSEVETLIASVMRKFNMKDPGTLGLIIEKIDNQSFEFKIFHRNDFIKDLQVKRFLEIMPMEMESDEEGNPFNVDEFIEDSLDTIESMGIFCPQSSKQKTALKLVPPPSAKVVSLADVRKNKEKS